MAWPVQRLPERVRRPVSLSQLAMAVAPRRSSTYLPKMGLHDGRFVIVDGQGLGAGVEVVAVGAAAGEPLAAGGFAFEAGGDAVDEQVALELGEDPEQLQQHPPDGALRVDGLGGRLQRDAGGFELFDDGHQPDDGAGEPVDAVDEQHVKRAGTGGVEGFLQAGPVEGGAGGLVDEAVGDRHRGL